MKAVYTDPFETTQWRSCFNYRHGIGCVSGSGSPRFRQLTMTFGLPMIERWEQSRLANLWTARYPKHCPLPLRSNGEAFPLSGQREVCLFHSFLENPVSALDQRQR